MRHEARHAAVVLALAEEADGALLWAGAAVSGSSAWKPSTTTSGRRLAGHSTAAERRPWAWLPPALVLRSTADISPRARLDRTRFWPQVLRPAPEVQARSLTLVR